jgi:D-3-phosphoglycerate dehydrogenase
MTMAKNVLITDKVHPVLIEKLTASGCDVVYDTSLNNESLDLIIHIFDGIIINSKIIMNKSRIDKGVRLTFIGRLGSGLEIIDVPYAKKKNIKVYNSPEGNRNAVAEHEMGMLLCLMNKLLISDREVRNFNWNREHNRGMEIKGKTIGIIGLGHTGSSLAEKLASWHVNVMSYDKYRKIYPGNLKYVQKNDLETILEKSDIISLHLPLTDETSQMVDDKFISKCKKGVIISNTSRGDIVDTQALINGLISGQVGGACLDVFENEKPETFSESEKEMYNKLYGFDNVILSPHIAGWTYESLKGIAEVLFTKIYDGNHL